jgi:signal transduction histidine kinase/ActR/RegA family two-component response regulator
MKYGYSELEFGRYRKLIDHIPLIVFSSEGLAISSNQTALRLLGIRKRLAKPFDMQAAGYAILDEAGRECRRERLPWFRALHTNRMLSGVVCQLVTPDGTRRWFEVTAMPVSDQYGVKAGLALCTLTNITDRKSRENYLADELKHVKTLATCFSRVICSSDTCHNCGVFRSVLRTAVKRIGATGRLCTFENHIDQSGGLTSRCVCNMAALSNKNGRSNDMHVSWRALPVDWQEALSRNKRVDITAEMHAGKGAEVLRRLDIKAGVLMPVFISKMWTGFIAAGDSAEGRAFSEDNQRLIRSIADIAGSLLQHKDAQSRLLQSQKMEMLGSLSGGLAHDFNNILANIRASLQVTLLEHEKGGSNVVEVSREINQEINEASELVRQLLLFSSPSKVQSRWIPVNERVRLMTRLFRRMIPKIIAVEVNLPSNEMVVRIESSHFEQVIMNLVLNARDAMPKGGTLKVGISLLRGDQIVSAPVRIRRKAFYVCVAVSDTGIGIPSDSIKRIFEPFYTTKRTEKGTGLGLSIVQSVVNHNRGCITVESEVSKGTAIRCYFPGKLKVEKKSGVKKRRNQGKTASGHETILVAEDGATMLKAIRDVLTNSGYKVLECKDGLQAMDTFKENINAISLVMLDIGLPGVMGDECLRQMRILKPRLKSILITGYQFDKAKESLFRKETNGFLNKPFDLAEAVATVRRVLDEKTPASR